MRKLRHRLSNLHKHSKDLTQKYKVFWFSKDFVLREMKRRLCVEWKEAFRKWGKPVISHLCVVVAARRWSMKFEVFDEARFSPPIGFMATESNGKMEVTSPHQTETAAPMLLTHSSFLTCFLVQFSLLPHVHVIHACYFISLTKPAMLLSGWGQSAFC